MRRSYESFLSGDGKSWFLIEYSWEEGSTKRSVLRIAHGLSGDEAYHLAESGNSFWAALRAAKKVSP